MESEKEHFRHILLFYYRKGKNAVHARQKLSDVYGDVLSARQCQNWFAKFRSGNFDVEDAPRSGRPIETDEQTIKELINENQQITTREIAERLNKSNSTVHDHMKRLGLISKHEKTKLLSEQPNILLSSKVKMSKRSLTSVASSANSKKPKHWSLGLLESMKDPESIVKESKRAVVIKDKYPKAKIHYLVLPQEDINSIYKLDKSHIELLEEFGDLFNKIQNEEELSLRAGFHAVPSMQRLHMHIISTDMVSPSLKTKVHWNSFTTQFFKPYADVLEELKEKGSIKKISTELHKSLMATELQCNQCPHKPKNMPQLKEHLLTHIK